MPYGTDESQASVGGTFAFTETKLLQAWIAANAPVTETCPDGADSQSSCDADGVKVDAVQFERLIEKGTSGALEEAVAIYRGGLLRDLDEAGMELMSKRTMAQLHSLWGTETDAKIDTARKFVRALDKVRPNGSTSI